jgi:putative transposase
MSEASSLLPLRVASSRVLFIHLIAILTQLHEPGGVRSLIAESLLLKLQLLIVNRSRRRSPNLSSWDRILAGWMTLLVRPCAYQ